MVNGCQLAANSWENRYFMFSHDSLRILILLSMYWLSSQYKKWLLSVQLKQINVMTHIPMGTAISVAE